MNSLIFSLCFAALAAAVLLVATRFDRRISSAAALACALYLGLDDLVTGLPAEFAAFDPVPGHWNWSGKLLSLALALGAIAWLRPSRAALGLVAPRHAATTAFALLLFIAWGALLGGVFRPGGADAETFAFQATMPALAEELVYRGLAPLLLLGLLRGRAPVAGIPWTVIVATATVFGLWHGLRYAGGEFGFDPWSALFPFIGSLAGGWLRFHSASLWPPMLAHALANVAFHLVGHALA